MGPTIPSNLALISKLWQSPPPPKTPPPLPLNPPLPPPTTVLKEFLRTTDILISLYFQLGADGRYLAVDHMQNMVKLFSEGLKKHPKTAADNINDQGEYVEDADEVVDKKPKLELIDVPERTKR